MELEPNINEILNLKMQTNDACARNIREYLYTLLADVWEEGERFSGKRPFGNSGWHYEIYTTLINNGFVDGQLDEYGYIEEVDSNYASQLISECIQYVFYRD